MAPLATLERLIQFRETVVTNIRAYDMGSGSMARLEGVFQACLAVFSNIERHDEGLIDSGHWPVSRWVTS